MVPGLWLLCYGRGQIQTNPHTLVHTNAQMDTHTHAHTQEHAIMWKHKHTQTGMKTGSSLISLLHMFPIRVKLLPERHVTAGAFTSGELNYLSDATFPFST